MQKGIVNNLTNITMNQLVIKLVNPNWNQADRMKILIDYVISVKKFAINLNKRFNYS